MTAKPDHLTFDITGMTCAACSARVEKVLSRQPGVEAASVNLALERADVKGEGLDAEKLATAIAKAGYGAILRRRDFAASRRADAEHDAARRAEERATLLRFAVSALLTLPIVIGMLPMMTGMGDAWIGAGWQAVLASGVMLASGTRFWREAFGALRGGSANMAVLVTLGTGAAYFWSLWVMWRGYADPHAVHGGGLDMASHLHFEAAATVLTLVMLGKYLEARAKSGAAGALRALGKLQPDTAERLDPATGATETVAVETLVPGDRIVIRPGARVPADGVIAEGRSSLDESMVTGESLPVARGPGDGVTTGTTNADGVLVVEVSAVGEDTRLARMTRLVEEAQSGQAPVQKLVDRISAVFVPVILVIAATTLAGWLAVGADFETAMVAAVAVLVIACPCALGLATPTALVAGTGAAARAGILIRDIETLERATDVKAIAFDKTGTLTLGMPEIVEIAPAEGVTETEILSLAASVEAGSEHPLARAVMRRAAADTIAFAPARAVTALPGRGLQGEVEGRLVRVGSDKLMREAGISVPGMGEETGSGSIAYVAAGNDFLGRMRLADTLRPAAREAVAELSAAGLSTLMLSGDNERTARAIAGELGLTDVRAGLLPAEKLDAIRRLSAETGGHVAFVGDGLNDAPALAAADLGIAMAGGTDAAREAADITLMRPDLRLVPAALDVAARTRRTIRTNLVWALIYNLVGVPLAAFGVLPPVFAGAAMAFSSVSVVTNSAWMARWKPRFATRG